jgi:hypothetical protein
LFDAPYRASSNPPFRISATSLLCRRMTRRANASFSTFSEARNAVLS